MAHMAHNLEALRVAPTQPVRMPPRSAARREGFTLIELLVVIAILAVLVSILLPALAQAKSLARRATCLSNVRGIGVATQFYVNRANSFPTAWVNSTCRWMDLIKPYVDKKSDVYRCPSDPNQVPVTWDPEIVLSYGINTFRFADTAHCFWYGVKADAVRRPGETILFADCTPGKYYCGGGGTFAQPVVDVDYRHLNKSFSAAFCDGHADTRQETRQLDWDASQ